MKVEVTPEAGRVLGEWLARWPLDPPCCCSSTQGGARAGSGGALAADIRKLCRSRGLTALVRSD